MAHVLGYVDQVMLIPKLVLRDARPVPRLEGELGLHNDLQFTAEKTA